MGCSLMRSLDCAIELVVGGITVQRVAHVATVNEGVTGGDGIHLARVESRASDQTPNTVKSMYSDLHHCAKVTRLRDGH